MRQQAAAQILRIYIGEDDKRHGKLLYPALIERLKEAGVAGVTVFKEVEGFGANGRLHTTRFEVMFQGLPIVIEAVDIPERISAVLPVLDEMVTEGLVTIHDVTAIRYNKEF